MTHSCPTVTPWTAAGQASLSITNSRRLLKLTSIESVMPSSHFILIKHRDCQTSRPLFQHVHLLGPKYILSLDHCITWKVNLLSYGYAITREPVCSPSLSQPKYSCFSLANCSPWASRLLIMASPSWAFFQVLVRKGRWNRRGEEDTHNC